MNIFYIIKNLKLKFKIFSIVFFNICKLQLSRHLINYLSNFKKTKWLINQSILISRKSYVSLPFCEEVCASAKIHKLRMCISYRVNKFPFTTCLMRTHLLILTRNSIQHFTYFKGKREWNSLKTAFYYRQGRNFPLPIIYIIATSLRSCWHVTIRMLHTSGKFLYSRRIY